MFCHFSYSVKKPKPAVVNIVERCTVLPAFYGWELVLWSSVQRGWKGCFCGLQRISFCFYNISWLTLCFWEGSRYPSNQRDPYTLCNTYHRVDEVCFQITAAAFRAHLARWRTSSPNAQESGNASRALQTSVWGYRQDLMLSDKTHRQPSWHPVAGWEASRAGAEVLSPLNP